MIGLWKKFKAWRQRQKDNHWRNWRRLDNYRWSLEHQSPTTEYYEMIAEYVNVVTGEREWRPYERFYGRTWELRDRKSGEVITSSDRYPRVPTLK